MSNKRPARSEPYGMSFKRHKSLRQIETAKEQQFKLRYDIEISCVPVLQNENLIDIVIKIASYAGVTITPNDISQVKRVQPRGVELGRPWPIIATFKNLNLKDRIIAGVIEKHGVTTRDLYLPGASHRLYVHQCLTHTNYNLFMKSKALATKMNYKFVWIKNGNVLVRKNDNSKIIYIGCEEDLLQIV